MNKIFTKKFKARWGDMDFNGHMANTAYLDAAADVRMMYFEEHGFPMREFERLRVGPVVMRDEIDYHRELRLMEEMEVHHEMASMSEDGARFKMRNTIYRADGRKCAVVTSTIGWMSLDERRLVRPPEQLFKALEAVPRTLDYENMNGTSR